MTGLAVGLAVVCGVTGAGPDGVDIGNGVYWFGGYPAPRVSMIGDVDADGLADFVGLYPPDGGILDFVRTSRMGKPNDNVQARRPFGADAIAVACGPLDREPGVEVMAVLPDGSVHTACGLDPASRLYTKDERAASIPPERLPKAPLQALIADFTGDARADAVLVGADGGLLLLVNTWDRREGKRLEPVPVSGRLGSVTRVAAGDFDGRGGASLVWLAGDGVLHSAQIVPARATTARLVGVRTILRDTPGNGLAVGRFTETRRADILIGQRLLPGGDPHRGVRVTGVPDALQARKDVAWLAGDLTGDGLDDLLRVRRTGDRFTGDDVIVHATHRTGEPPAIADTDADGLRDAWEDGRAKPGGLDLVALGCSPTHADVICEVQPIEGVSDERLHSEVERARAYYDSLPVANPDGAYGIRFHPIFREPIPKDREAEGWEKLSEAFHPSAHRGVTHWMVIGTGGGGQSGQMADAGGCGQSALFATFVHEFGHQLGLDHSGFWDAGWSPTYPSMMNYSYSYQLNGRADEIAYSRGALASMELDERHLDEYLPVPPAGVSYLSGPPYRFHVQPADDGKGTLVDWNWNGVFGEKDIRADINYGYSTNAGPRHKLGQARTVIALAAHGEGATQKLLLFAGDLKRDGSGVAEPYNGAAPSVDVLPPLRLYLRVWDKEDPEKQGDEWSEELPIETDGVTGDPAGAYVGGATWVCYPTDDGVHIRRVTLDAAGAPAIGPAQVVPSSAGAQPTLVPWDDRALLLLWRDANTPVGCIPADLSGETPVLGAEQPLPLTGLVPVGAAQGPDGKSLWVGLTENQDEPRPSRWQVRRLERQADGTFTEAFREWIGGVDAPHRGEGRVILLCEPSSDFPDGQVCFLQCGMLSGTPASSCHYIGMRVKDQEVHHGWMVRRYYDEWSTSSSGPGASFLRGDIAYAMRWAAAPDSDGGSAVHVGFFGRGFDHGKTGDFDDIDFVRDIGLSHSIPCVVGDG